MDRGTCSALSSYVRSRHSGFPEGWNVPCGTNQSCTACVITAKKVKLYHWPLPTTVECVATTKPSPSPSLNHRAAAAAAAAPASAAPASSTHSPISALSVLSDGITFTSPTLYISFYDIKATDPANGLTCGGGPPPTGAAAIASFAPADVRSVRYGAQRGAYPFRVDDLAHTTATGRVGGAVFSIALVPPAAYAGQYSCNPGSRCAVIRDDYRPTVVVPSDDGQLMTMGGGWGRCDAFDAGYGLQVVAVEEIGKGGGGSGLVVPRRTVAVPTA
ncbi:uncharacterized protein BKCO1_1000090 [Diplodia corticola]|uniref:Uncharacterized protein n=1 Tax=Diplodia corticola TaxID=236234 RepID=A0A1J9SA19_9PEZI|nr:uncharacterized protein BKCO1_1000090 [Diplodia corticola]OJD36732.1 hypothetical protein BKCO1_1000090 [Diplodia corticola]